MEFAAGKFLAGLRQHHLRRPTPWNSAAFTFAPGGQLRRAGWRPLLRLLSLHDEGCQAVLFAARVVLVAGALTLVMTAPTQYRFPIFMMDFVVPGPVAMLPVAGQHIARRDAGLARPVVSAEGAHR
jgi:hypothetical protein